MKGVFLINKPKNITSHDAVDFLRRLTGERRIGHAGTLDPAATGLMIVAIGREFTKQLGEFIKLDKEYVAEVTLGVVSATYDIEGPKKHISNRRPGLAEILRVTKSFLGKHQQAPPIFSAKKIGGEPAYKLARAGRVVKLSKQEVRIYSLKIETFRYPKLRIRVRVSSGTYIRSLAHDLGEGLGIGAYLSRLRRTQIGGYKIRSARRLKNLKRIKDLAKIRIRPRGTKLL